MRIVEVMGGFGNQMFNFAFLLALSDVHKQQIKISTVEIEKSYNHNGYELDKIFDINCKKHNDLLRRVLKSKVLSKHLLKQYHEEQNLEYDNKVLKNKSSTPIKYYCGYWQNELYFKGIEDKVRKVFSFDEHKFSEKTTNLAKIIKNDKHSVSIHIRRGDYYSDPSSNVILGNICTIDYYNNAIKEIKSRIKDANFYIFSDEPKWVKENFHALEGSLIIDWNKGADSWQDMALMSLCSHHIIANSSFSWWGAWLSSPYEGKVVIAPNKWLNTTPSTAIVPERWIKIATTPIL